MRKGLIVGGFIASYKVLHPNSGFWEILGDRYLGGRCFIVTLLTLFQALILINQQAGWRSVEKAPKDKWILQVFACNSFRSGTPVWAPLSGICKFWQRHLDRLVGGELRLSRVCMG